MELAFKTITSIDILVWVVGISALRALTSTPLKRGNETRGAGVNSSEHGAADGAKGGMDKGSDAVEGNGRGRLVRLEDVNSLYEGRFARRQKSLDKLKRDNSDRVVRNIVSTCHQALREPRRTRTQYAKEEAKTHSVATGTTVRSISEPDRRYQ